MMPCFIMMKQLVSDNSLHVMLLCLLYFVGGDPLNYLSYFKRATVFLAIGRAKSALPDLDKVIELKPDFKQVTILMKYSLPAKGILCGFLL